VGGTGVTHKTVTLVTNASFRPVTTKDTKLYMADEGKTAESSLSAYVLTVDFPARSLHEPVILKRPHAFNFYGLKRFNSD
jgi:hypothetical protein